MRTTFLILLIAIGLYVLYALVIYLFQKQLIFHPSKLPRNHIFSFDNISKNCQELFIEASDGVRLNALLFETKEPKGIIIYYHGNAGNLESWGSIAGEYIQRGYHFIVWDYREYGKSEGKLSYKKLMEDSETIFQYGKEKYPDIPAIPYGVSLGTALASHVAHENQTDKVLLETPYYSMQKLAREYFPGLPYDLFLNYPLNTYQELKNYRGKVFIVHGTKDQIVPYKNSELLKATFPEKIELTTIHGSGHNDLPFFEGYEGWLDKALGSPIE